MRSSHPATLPASSVYRVQSPPAFAAPSLRKNTLTWLSRARVFKKFLFTTTTPHLSYALQTPLCNHSASGEPSDELPTLEEMESESPLPCASYLHPHVSSCRPQPSPRGWDFHKDS